MITGLFVLGWVLTVLSTVKVVPAWRARPTKVGFGPTPVLDSRQRDLMITTYLAQQRLAFKLAEAAVGAGVLLGVLILARVAAGRTIDVTTLASVVGVVGNIGVGAGAVNLYDRASKRLEETIKGTT